MKWNFKLRGKEVSLTIVDAAAAVQPTAELREQFTRSQIIQRFGANTKDDEQGGKFGIDVPARNRKIFERAGWLFVEPQQAVASAARARVAVEGTQAVREVLISRSGDLLIGTNLVTVQLPEDMSEDEAIRQMGEDGLKLVRRLRFAPNMFEARVPVRRPLPEIIYELQSKTERYRFAEPALLEAITGRQRPNDPEFCNQWQHANDGSNGGTAGADIHSVAAWEITRGVGPQRPVRIAVIDTGMQINHPDLKSGIVGGGFFQPDGQGSATFVKLQPGMTGFPSRRHGTFCMGMAGARINNGRGGCGSAPEADLLAIACLVDQIGTQATLARAVAYAADPSREDAQAAATDGADVISCSLGPNSADWDLTTVLDVAIRFAATQGRQTLGVPMFWAVSNGNFEIARDEVCSHENVLAIGCSNRNDMENDSAFGPKLEFLAPGVDVFSTRPGNQNGFETGASFAAPLAAGVGALVLARDPTLTATQVRDRLRASCDKVGGVIYNANGHHDEYGFGRINAHRAVQ